MAHGDEMGRSDGQRGVVMTANAMLAKAGLGSRKIEGHSGKEVFVVETGESLGQMEAVEASHLMSLIARGVAPAEARKVVKALSLRENADAIEREAA